MTDLLFQVNTSEMPLYDTSLYNPPRSAFSPKSVDSATEQPNGHLPCGLTSNSTSSHRGGQNYTSSATRDNSDEACAQRPARSALRPRRRERLKNDEDQNLVCKSNNVPQGARGRSNSERPPHGRLGYPVETKAPTREASAQTKLPATAGDDLSSSRGNSHSTGQDKAAPRSSSLQPQKRSPFATSALPSSPRPSGRGFSSSPAFPEQAVFASPPEQFMRRDPIEIYQQRQREREKEQTDRDLDHRRSSAGTSSNASYQSGEAALYTPSLPSNSPTFSQSQYMGSQATHGSYSASVPTKSQPRQGKEASSKKSSKLKSKLANLFIKDEETVKEDSQQVKIEPWADDGW